MVKLSEMGKLTHSRIKSRLYLLNLTDYYKSLIYNIRNLRQYSCYRCHTEVLQ